MTLEEIIASMASVHALVIGDAICDEYIFCRSDRICPEAPVPVLVPERRERRPGGARNVVAQLKALGVSTHELFGYPVSLKQRYMVGHQLVLRVDTDCQAELAAADGIAVFDELVSQRRPDVIVLSDYAKGTLSDELCQHVIEEAGKRSIYVVVDPKGKDWSKYWGAELLCPNQKEYDAVRRKLSMSSDMVIKRGEHGLHVSTDDISTSLPAQARHVFDVTGAGDTVVAVLAAAIAAGAKIVPGAQLANLAAGYVVGEIGTTVCPKDKLLELLGHLK